MIELLIVVVIIAILAAIAVPNFLEAQTRVKLARLRADMRTTAVAIRAYESDWSDTIHQWSQPIVPAVPGHRYFGGFFLYFQGQRTEGRRMTTPIVYLSSIPLDFFNFKSHFNAQRKQVSVIMTSQMLSEPPLPNTGFTYRWALSSAGPDGLWRDETWGPGAHHLDSWFDPTNGTISGGDINYWDSIGYQGGEY